MEQLQAALSAHSNGRMPQGVAQLMSLLSTSIEPLDVHICSTGGVGSTTMNNFLTRHGLKTNLLADTDGMRHSPVPPEWCLPGSPDVPHPAKPRMVLYMYGDPYEIVVSHYRRGHAYHQACKTNRHPAALGPEQAFPATAEQYFQKGQDLFDLQAHFQSWAYGADAYDILLLRYESMFDPAVAHRLFWQLCGHKLNPEQILQLVQVWVAQKALRISQVPDSVRKQGMYAGLLSSMNSVPGLHQVPARRRGAAQQATMQATLDSLTQLMGRKSE